MDTEERPSFLDSTSSMLVVLSMALLGLTFFALLFGGLGMLPTLPLVAFVCLSLGVILSAISRHAFSKIISDTAHTPTEPWKMFASTLVSLVTATLALFQPHALDTTLYLIALGTLFFLFGLTWMVDNKDKFSRET